MATRTRFAPSPTGFMHVGGVRTALFAWLVAKQAGGQFILRLEDTDKKREVSGADQHIFNSLKTLGIVYGEGPDVGGDFGPYRQSERLDIYKKWAQKLIEGGRAYADPYSVDEVQGFRDQAQKAKQPFLYRNHRPDKTKPWDGSTPLRFKSEPKNYTWQDAVMGELKTGPEVIDDFILIKSDGFPTYNFAHIVDDAEMRVSHVIRGQEFLASVPNYLNLYEALGLKPPIMATLPHILNELGNKKLSKRDGAKDVLEYVDEGYLPEALVNFMALLGWNDGTEQEIFTTDELIKKFSLERVQKSGARFDEQKLVWLNGSHIRQLPLDSLYKKVKDFWPKAAAGAKEQYRKLVLGLVQERLKFFKELPGLTSFFFEAPSQDSIKQMLLNPPDKQLKKIEQSTCKNMLEATIKTLDNVEFDQAKLETHLNQLLTNLGTKPGVLFALIRIALTASAASPPIAGCLVVLGKDESLKRLHLALAALA